MKPKYKLHKTFRVSTWDYSENGYYFVTICTKNRKNYFGKVIQGGVYLSRIGKIVKKELHKTIKIRENVFLDEWIIMPNHIHAIFMIENHYIPHRTGQSPVPTEEPCTLKFGKVKSGSLSTIIGSFKCAVTMNCRKNNLNNFAWQPRFYDHIIRNDKDLYNIREYIKNNPLNWESERNNPNNL